MEPQRCLSAAYVALYPEDMGYEAKHKHGRILFCDVNDQYFQQHLVLCSYCQDTSLMSGHTW